MTRGTTTDEIIMLDGVDLKSLIELRVTFRQAPIKRRGCPCDGWLEDAEEPYTVEKTLDDAMINFKRREIHIQLSQKETLGFSDKSDVFVQARGVLYGGAVFATGISEIMVKPILKGGEI